MKNSGDDRKLPKTTSSDEIGLGDLLTLDANLMNTLQKLKKGNDNSSNEVEFQIQETEPGRFLVVAATFDKLLNFLSSDTNKEENELIDHIVFTYSYFTDIPTFLSKIINKLVNPTNEPPRLNRLNSSTENLNINAQKKFQFLLLNLLKRWMRCNASIFREDPTFEATLAENLQKMSESSETSGWVESLNVTYSAVKNKKLFQRLVSFDDSLPPVTNVLDGSFKPEEIAQQLTLIEFDYFRNVEATKELLHKHFTKAETSPLLHKWIGVFNKMTGWISKEVLQHNDPKVRGTVISRIIDIAQELYRLKNFNGMMQLVMALNQSSISRLKQSWKHVSTRHTSKFDELLEIMNPSNNNGAYRKALNRVLPPFIPFQAVILRDLTFIEESPDTLSNTSHIINFTKMSLLGNLMKAIHKAQTAAYSFPQIPAVLKYFQEISTDSIPDEMTLYNLSKSLEPPSGGSQTSSSSVTPRTSKKSDKSTSTTCVSCTKNLAEISSLKKEIDESRVREGLLREMLSDKNNGLSTSSSSMSLSTSSGGFSPFGSSPTSQVTLGLRKPPASARGESGETPPFLGIPIRLASLSSSQGAEDDKKNQQYRMLLDLRQSLKNIDLSTQAIDGKNSRALGVQVSSASFSLEKLITSFEDSIV